jgi:hypothetical protein
LVESGVDHFHACISQGAGNHLGTAIVAIEAWLSDNNSKWS